MISITAEPRKVVGKKVRNLRKKELVPGSITVAGKESIVIQVPLTEARKLLGHRHLEVVEVTIGKDKYTTVIEDVFMNPLNNKIMTINLNQITNDRYTVVDMPIEISGMSPAVKNNLGIMIIVNKSIRLRTKLDAVKPFLEVDVTGLEEVLDSIKISDLKLPEGMVIDKAKDYDLTLVSIAPPQKIEEIVAAPVQAVGEDGELLVDEEGNPIMETPEGAEGAEGAPAAEGAEGAAPGAGQPAAEGGQESQGGQPPQHG